MACSVYRVNVVEEMVECDWWAAGMVAFTSQSQKKATFLKKIFVTSFF